MKKISIILLLVTSTTVYPATINRSVPITLNLLAKITISKVQDLIFPNATLTGSAFNIVVDTGDSGAATFNATGGNNRSITRSVTQPSINMTAPGAVGSILVDSFTVSGPTAFDPSGNANGLKVGATAHILASSEDGDYSGSATLRVTYQ